MGRYHELVGELISEAVALIIIITFGCSAAAMYFLYDPSPYKTAYWGLCITWGLSVSIAIYVTGAVSGTHANPAVTLALAVFRGFAWKKVVPYWIAQVVGAFIGAAIVYGLYSSVIDSFNATQHMARAEGGASGVFFTSPGLAITPARAFVNEITITAFLVFGIFALTDEFNTIAPRANFGAIVIGLIVAVIGASSGYLEGWALNPARDFGPRVFAWLAGWDKAAFPGVVDYWWVPIAGPLIGGLVGGGAQHLLIRPFYPHEKKLSLESAK
ncbi:aquaporin family protein [Neorhizobium sp. P12A]|uniref:MIP/aquaporin family protein n=2 Tax=Rhizobium/Agrobacterium group TaxID=227290 RepID=UPI00104C89CF|nr:MIP/aquaporin family protein [Rhizobium sp. BK376]KAA0695622.1 aquaporin family protein [Neorhizobium sp. P12A]TCR70995.1 glycerol uptake facilitator protein [Rhizobium sp. BK376]